MLLFAVLTSASDPNTLICGSSSFILVFDCEFVFSMCHLFCCSLLVRFRVYVVRRCFCTVLACMWLLLFVSMLRVFVCACFMCTWSFRCMSELHMCIVFASCFLFFLCLRGSKLTAWVILVHSSTNLAFTSSSGSIQHESSEWIPFVPVLRPGAWR